MALRLIHTIAACGNQFSHRHIGSQLVSLAYASCSATLRIVLAPSSMSSFLAVCPMETAGNLPLPPGILISLVYLQSMCRVQTNQSRQVLPPLAHTLVTSSYYLHLVSKLP